MTPYTSDEAWLARVLNGYAFVAAVLCLVSLVGAYFGPSGNFFVEPPFVSNTVAGLGLLALLAWFSAGDVRRFRAMIAVLLSGLVIGAVSFIVLYFSPKGALQPTPLLVGAAVSIIAAGTLAWFLSRAKPAAPAWSPWIPDKLPTTAEKIARVIMGAFGLFSILAAPLHLIFAYTAPAGIASFMQMPVMLGGSTIKIGLLGVCALLAAWNVRRYATMITLLILAHAISFVAASVALLGVNRFGITALTVGSTTINTQQLMPGVMALDGVIVIAFWFLHNAVDNSLLDYLGFFNPLQFRALEAISESLIDGGASRKVLPYQIGLRTDRYLRSFPSSRLWLAKLAVLGLEFSPLMFFAPPLSFQHPAARRAFIDRNFKQDIVNSWGIYWLLNRPGLRRLIDFIEGAARFNMQLTYMGYYSDPRVQKDIGYVPFSERPKDFPVKPIRRYPPLKVTTPDDLRREGIDVMDSADVVIIGSGAAGSIMAEQLVSQGRDVLLLEKGPYVNPDDFTEDEIDMVSQLYADGAIQISQALRFSVLQGSCVGGSTVVNNAVCFDTPQRVLDKWNDPNGSNAGIDVDRYREAQRYIRERMMIHSVRDSAKTRPWEDTLNPTGHVLSKGISTFLNGSDYKFDVVDANIMDCLGCGYCNIGCAYGRKLSMLDEVLPKTQRDHPDQLRIISEAQVTKLNGTGSHINEIVVTLRDKRQLVIRNPKTVIVSAGTVASSWLLMRSGIGKGELPVGRGLCFNMGSPLHARFEDKLDSYAGLQIAHYLLIADHPGFVYETWYNPPVAQSLSMPGWLDTHFKNMLRYDHMAAVGVLVGSDTNAYLTPALFLRGAPDIVYTPTEKDLDTLLDALTILGQCMFAAGAKEVFASTRSYKSYTQGAAVYREEDDLKNLRKIIKDDRDIFLGTGHPQGGNPISKNRGKNGSSGGVIGPDFKVYGYDNLYVCDASVFPSATTVNPQLTVMTMAHYASALIS